MLAKIYKYRIVKNGNSAAKQREKFWHIELGYKQTESNQMRRKKNIKLEFCVN